jgi:hypothetical protein
VLRTLCGNAAIRPNPLPRKRGSTRVGAVREPPLQVTPEKAPSGTKSPRRGRLQGASSGSLGRGCYFSTLDFRLLDFEELNERNANVYENKGALWTTRSRSGNVYENTGSYQHKAGMLLKRKVVNEPQGVSGGGLIGGWRKAKLCST